MKMRILIATGLYPPEIGGPATYAKLFEERLPHYGIEVSVLPFKTVRHLPPIIRHIAYGWKVSKATRDADLILVQDSVSTGLPVAIASLFSGKKFVIRLPGDSAWQQGPQCFGVRESLDDFQKRTYGLRVSILRAIQRFVVNRAHRVIAPSKYLARIVAGWLKHPRPIDVVYNGIKTASLTSGAAREPGLIVSAGRLVPWKGFQDLIEVAGKHAEWRLDILGDGPQRTLLEEQIEKRGAKERITLRGNVPNAQALDAFAKASIFVLNSSYEGLSHTLVEAMATGAPVIATRVGGNPEVVQDGVNGMLVGAGDKEGLEKALTSLMSDASLRDTLGAAAANRAKDFSIDKTVEATASLIKSCVS